MEIWIDALITTVFVHTLGHSSIQIRIHSFRNSAHSFQLYDFLLYIEREFINFTID